MMLVRIATLNSTTACIGQPRSVVDAAALTQDHKPHNDQQLSRRGKRYLGRQSPCQHPRPGLAPISVELSKALLA
jgi:hypothetical protein